MKNFPDLYIFAGLSEQEVHYFLLMSEPIDFKNGETIMSEGEASDNRAYVIESGEARVLKDGKEIARLGEGSLFGEIALITNDRRTATIEAVGPLKVLALAKDDFLLLAKKSGKYDEIKMEILRRIKENFNADLAV